MERLSLKASLGLCLLTSMNLTSFADVGVPDAAIMVDKANFIALGIIQPTQPPTFKPIKIIKGEELPESSLGLVDPSKGQFLTFNLSRVTEIVGTMPTIVLGQLDEKKSVLSLTWLNASLWPQGYRYDTFDSETQEKTQAFLEQLLKYSTMVSYDPDSAIRALIMDVENGRTQAALAYLEVAVEADFDASSAEHIRAVVAAALKPSLDAASARQLADISYVFLVSLFTPLALDLTEGATAEDSKRLHAALHSMLKARGAAVEPSSSVDEMRGAFAKISANMRQTESRRLLSIFDSQYSTLRETYSDALMTVLVGKRPPEDLQDLSSAQKKEIWSGVIDTISN